MNFWRGLSFVLVLVLAGCASTGRLGSTGKEDAQSHAGAGGLVALQKEALPSNRVAGIPGGPLQPLAQAGDGLAPRSVAPLVPPADLWERIRRGYAMPNLDNPLVHEREQWYVERADYIRRMAERSRKYLFHVVEQLELRNMPTELALLPFVESAFNPQAVSSAKAAGMWQFMPATGRYFDLKQNAFRDDRRDVLASTDAALDYLQKLHGMFGDWHLALAAYNWGEGNVGRAIARNQKANRPTGYEDLDMPAETRLYVPKLQALKNIIAAPQDFATAFPTILNHPYFQAVSITHDIDVEQVARLAEVDIADFKALNPSIDRPVIMAAGTPQILLPWDNATIFETNLRAAGNTPLASWTVWKAPRTMSADEAARSVGMGVGELRAVNHIPSRMLIKAGSTLLVPRADSVHHDVDETVADNGQVSLSPEVVLLRRTLKAGKNDSVASIARRYHLSASSVARWNDVGVNARFKRGQRITVFMPARAEHVVPLRAKPKANRARHGPAKVRASKSRAAGPRQRARAPVRRKAARR